MVITTVEEVPVFRKANYFVSDVIAGVAGRVTVPSKITVPNTSTLALKARLLSPIK